MNEYEFLACRQSAALVKYTGSAKQVVIPPCFDGKPVIEIGPGAFANHFEVTSIILPQSIERIEVNAFGWARNLAFVGTDLPEGDDIPEMSVLPPTVRFIGPRAFEYNVGIKKLTILGEEVEIDDYAFASSHIEEVFLPNCRELNLQTGAFIHCAKLKHFVAPLADAGTISSCCFEGCLKLQQMDARFAAVGYSGFHGCQELYKIHLPQTLAYAEPDAFKGCTLLAGKRKYIR
jgi:hypothetical protein